MQFLIFLAALVIGLAVLAGVTVLLTVLLLALIAAPSFWAAFWFILVALLAVTGLNKAL
ncbi:hypothetical protein HOU45_gp60 [Microbacterium phage Armstrong]|uniref:Uncharacterized protein n=1 Tax=Microbacterium phage Armstrong TaxID=2419971 RepID=A0A3G2KDH4_9CAUD|nr:hypothetical protein HOU45_gp60 [Microbacterium phage Armstrong]AYN56945.1 hypothetical protein PBI_ARMSTRONG_60 [Microbacterium phage Armstrong]